MSSAPPSRELVDNVLSAGHGISPCGSTGDARTSRLLCRREDPNFLSDLYCFLRRHVEVFVTTAVDIDQAMGGDLAPRRRRSDNAAVIGKVGMRCVHCAKRRRGSGSGNLSNRETRKQPRGEVSYPQSIRLFYQAVRNWQRYHLMACLAIPEEVKMEYVQIKRNRTRSCQNVLHYWEECCRQMGMVDASDGIWLQNGYFEDLGDFGPGFDASIMRRPTNSDLNLAEVNQNDQSVASTAIGGENGIESANVWNPSPALTNSTVQHISSRDDFHLIRERDVMNQRVNDGAPFCGGRELSGLSSDCNSTLSCQSLPFPELNTLARTIEASLPIERLSAGSLQDDKEISGLKNVVGQTRFAPPSEQDAFDVQSRISSFSKEHVGQRIQLALSVVKAIQEIRHVPLSHSSSPKEAGGEPYEAVQNDQHRNDLHLIGVGLYELLSGQKLSCDFGSHGDEGKDPHTRDNKEDVVRQKKKGKRIDMLGFVPLSEFGFPPALCFLVSSLLESGSSCEKRSNYESISDVEDDLGFLLSNADKILCEPTFSSLRAATSILYGREEEVSQLHEAFSCVTDASGAGTREMVFLSGSAGTGKSSIVEHVRFQFSERGACFVSGKFDTIQSQPFSAIVSAMNDYCCFIAQDDNRIDVVRKEVRSVIGSERCAALVRLVPNLVKVFGPTECNKTLIHANEIEALNRLMLIFKILLRTTSSTEHPVVIFLDDLHWADEMSLVLMHELLTDRMVEGLLLIACYRSNEVGEDHQLEMVLGDIRRSSSVSIRRICIENLCMKSVNLMISDILCLTPCQTHSLAKAVWKKTGGNARFVHQFLASLSDEGVLRFSFSSRRWEWSS